MSHPRPRGGGVAATLALPIMEIVARCASITDIAMEADLVSDADANTLTCTSARAWKKQ